MKTIVLVFLSLGLVLTSIPAYAQPESDITLPENIVELPPLDTKGLNEGWNTVCMGEELSVLVKDGEIVDMSAKDADGNELPVMTIKVKQPGAKVIVKCYKCSKGETPLSGKCIPIKCPR